MTGGEALVAVLAELGVEVAFGLPGVHNLAAWAAFADSEVRLVGVRHEQTAVYAADGYARATGRLGVALTTTGPGAANTLGACGEAWASRSPVLVIATDIPTTLRRPGVYRGVLHETTDQGAMFAPVVKEVVRVATAEQISAAVRRAAAVAATAPTRPVFLEIPTDLLSASVPTTNIGFVAPRVPTVDPIRLTAAADLVASAQRPLVWVGGGAINASRQVAALAERLAAPVVTTYAARGLLGPDHPCAVGLPPHLPECGTRWDAADLVIAVGSDFDAMMTQAWRQPAPERLLVVNVDAADGTKNYPADVVLAGDAGPVLDALVPLLPDRSPDVPALQAGLVVARRDALTRLRAEHPAELDLLEGLAAALPPEAVVVADMCIPGYWWAALGAVAGPRRLAYPVGWGTLGFAFPASIGSALAAAGPVVCLCGDGGFLFACGELATVAQERPPLTVVIVDDGGYGMLRYDQQTSGQREFGVDLATPDFVALARSFGLPAERVEGVGADFAAALARQVADPAPSVLVVAAALTPPPSSSPRWYRPR